MRERGESIEQRENHIKRLSRQPVQANADREKLTIDPDGRAVEPLLEQFQRSLAPSAKDFLAVLNSRRRSPGLASLRSGMLAFPAGLPGYSAFDFKACSRSAAWRLPIVFSFAIAARCLASGRMLPSSQL